MGTEADVDRSRRPSTSLPCGGGDPRIVFENVREWDLAKIWRESDAFERFRGEEWMQEPCRSCERRTVDFGGCRCQALLITGDAAATDPACSLSPQHELVELATQNSAEENAHPSDPLKLWMYRPDPTIGDEGAGCSIELLWLLVKKR